MKDIRIIIEPFCFLNILECTINKKINEHATATVKGIISEEMEDQYVEMALQEVPVMIKVVDDGGNETVIFSGIARDVSVHNENHVRTLTAELITESYRMDHMEYTRTFQDANMTYDDVLNCIGAPYENYDVILTTGSGTAIGDLITQYKETDWAFAKRLVSHFNSFLVPNYTMEGEKYFFGMPNKGEGKDIDPISYTLHKAVGEYLNKTHNQVEGLQESDAIYYCVKDREIYDLGQKVNFNGHPLYVYEIRTRMEGQELIHHYSLKTKTGFKIRQIFNERMIGASLEGTIIAVKQDKVKIHAHCDKEQNREKAKWFNYSTVYSSPDGTGWYCMPEEGDSVRLYFPNETEPEGYVISAAHLTSSAKEARTNPDHKSLRTKWGKELLLTPDAMIMTNNKGMSIQLLDADGIHIISNKAIKIISEEAIAISSATADLQVTAAKKVNLKQNQSQMTLQENVIFSGSQVNIQE